MAHATTSPPGLFAGARVRRNGSLLWAPRNLWGGALWLYAMVAFLSVAVVCVFPRPVAAASPAAGIYVILNPYSPADVHRLQNAASAPCGVIGKAVATPFCGATNGILLRMPWCDFQLYHPAQGAPAPSCHYTVGYSKGVGSAGLRYASTDTISPCSATFDTCSGASTSTLGASLKLIGQIDALRLAAGLPQLKLSLGLYAGGGTPQGVLDSTGYVDVSHNAYSRPNGVLCMRLPLYWKASYLASYNIAVDQMVAYTQAQLGQGANITILKAAGLTSSDLEVSVPGRAYSINTAADTGPGIPDASLNCSSKKTSAQVWLDAYTQKPNPGQTFSQATEAALGTIVGHDVGSLSNAGLAGTLLSYPITNSSAFASIDCGYTGSSPCSVQTDSSDWSNYYFELYVSDLFNAGLAYTAASTAFSAIHPGALSLPPTQVSVNWTGISPAAIVASAQITCALNNTQVARAPSLLLDKKLVQMVGPGTAIGWQTNINQGLLCRSSGYQNMLNNAIASGGQFIEVEADAAFDDIASCAPYLTAALTQILTEPAATTCSY